MLSSDCRGIRELRSLLAGIFKTATFRGATGDEDVDLLDIGELVS